MIDLKQLRFENGRMNQEELASKSGVNRTTISAIENGKEPSVSVAKKLARVFNIDWKRFYD